MNPGTLYIGIGRVHLKSMYESIMKSGADVTAFILAIGVVLSINVWLNVGNDPNSWDTCHCSNAVA